MGSLLDRGQLDVLGLLLLSQTTGQLGLLGTLRVLVILLVEQRGAPDAT